MRDTQYKVIQSGCMSTQGGIRWLAVNIRVYSEWSVYKDVGMSIRKVVRDIKKGKEGGRRGGGVSGGYVTRHCDFPKRTQKFSQASIAILKAMGSDKSSVKFESLICLPPYYLNRK